MRRGRLLEPGSGAVRRGGHRKEGSGGNGAAAARRPTHTGGGVGKGQKRAGVETEAGTPRNDSGICLEVDELFHPRGLREKTEEFLKLFPLFCLWVLCG